MATRAIFANNLQPSVRKEDLEEFSEVAIQCTVVIKGSSHRALDATIARLNNREYRDQETKVSYIGIDETFSNLIPLYESSKAAPTFDVIFVHGLGGHAFRSWSSTSADHAQICMWPRDVLPNYLEECQLHGRYFTFGYPAGWFGAKRYRPFHGETVNQSIQDAAAALITAIGSLRSDEADKSRDRPLFFVCHSLGGLVVCQTVVSILKQYQTPNVPNDSMSHYFFHSWSGLCLIRGVTFFGTPFKGSFLANMAAPLLTILVGRTTFVASLKMNNTKRNDMISEFHKIRNLRYMQLQVVNFHETQKLKKIFIETMVTDRDSALISPDDRLESAPLFLDHNKMIKFSSPSDSNFVQVVGPKLRFMIQRGLDIYENYKKPAAMLGSIDLVYPHPFISVGAQTHGAASSDATAEYTRPRLGGSAIDTTSTSPPLAAFTEADQWLRDEENQNPEARVILALLFSNIKNRDPTVFMNSQLQKIRDPFGETCDFISEERLYNQFEDGGVNNIAIIRGIEGTGKSVLAKAVISRLRRRHPSAAVLWYFCQNTGVRNSPAMIMRYLILQLNQHVAGLVRRVLVEWPQKNLFSAGYEIDTLWALFQFMLNLANKDVFIVIDGLDESLKRIDTDSDSAKHEDVVKFLKTLCDTFTGISTGQGRPQRTSVLVTTRPRDDVADAVGDRDIVIEIPSVDVRNRAALFLESEVRRLVTQEKLPRDLEQLVSETLNRSLRQTDSAFQWAQHVIAKLESTSEPTTNVLGSIRPGIYAVYEEVLISFRQEPSIADIVEELISILVFGFKPLSLNAIGSALGIAYALKSSEAPEIIYLQKFRDIANLSRGLIVIDDKDEVKFSHESVRDFFKQLSPQLWPEFSCKKERTGHQIMAFLCVQYLYAWPHQLLDERELNRVSGNRVDALLARSHFLNYAGATWTHYLRLAGELSGSLKSLLQFLLRQDTFQYAFAVYCIYSDEKSDETMHPSFFLARQNLLHIFRDELGDTGRQNTRFKRYLKKFGMSKSPKLSNSPDGSSLSFVVDERAADSDGDTLLHNAARAGAFDDVKLLLDRGAVGSVRNHQHATPFSLAIAGKHENVAEELILKGQAFLEKYDGTSATSLHLACLYNMNEVVTCLLGDKGMNPNILALDEKWTPLHVAAQAGHERIVKLLLDKGGDVMSTKSDKANALLLAAEEGHLQICKLLISNRPGLLSSSVDEDNHTPLHYAILHDNIEMAKFFLEKGAKYLPLKDDGMYASHTAARYGSADMIRLIVNEANVRQRDIYGQHPLHLACERGYLEGVTALINLGADRNAKRRDFRFSEFEELSITPLAAAVLGDQRDVVEYLMELEGVEIRLANSPSGETLLHMAAVMGNLDLARKLVEMYNEDAFVPRVDGCNPFMLAARKGAILLVKYFWSLPKPDDFSIGATSSGGDDALLSNVGSENANKEVARFLLEKGADPNLRDQSGRTSMFKCCLCAPSMHPTQKEVLKTLLDFGGNLSQVDWLRNTHIHQAAYFGFIEAIQLLHDNGADINAINRLGESPLVVAINAGRIDICEWLVRQGANCLALDQGGYSFMEIAKRYPKLWAMPELQPWKKMYRPLETRVVHVKNGMLNWLSMDMAFHTGEAKTVEELEWAVAMGSYLFFLGELEDARVCDEHGIDRDFLGRPMPRFICVNCHQSRRGSMWLCKSCSSGAMVCMKCYEEREEGKFHGLCQESHEFIEVGGESWRKLKEGTVNKEGLTFQQFVDQLRERYGVRELFDPFLLDQDLSKGSAS